MLSIVILTFNSKEAIKSCLDSIFKHNNLDFEVIVVDNGSRDNSLEYIKTNYPKIKLIENKNNLGAALARNQGIEAANGKWILTLDCDVILEAGFIQKIIELANNVNDKVGLIQPKILSQNERMIYSCGISHSWLGRFHDVGKGESDKDKFNTPRLIFGACCASALYRRKMLNQIKDSYGYFDERFFFLFEDVDLSWRAQKNGWFCRYSPELKCFHQGNSSATNINTRQYLSFLNRHRLILKNQNLMITLFMLPLYLVYDLPRFLILLFKFKGKFPKFLKL